ncbi:MAG: cyclic nucleotide-binding/CBS domain-containing protein [Nitrospirae bacterium]|nr:cyclic nucleotide-binding/CBS domain-containing protein [Nitrospirota bacterium]
MSLYGTSFSRGCVVVILDEVVLFLRKVPPFQFLSDRALKGAIKGIVSEFYPKGSVIATVGGPGDEYLFVIRKGGAKRSLYREGEETLVDYRGEGEVIGYLSLFGEDVPWTNITAIDDTICYLLRKDRIKGLIDTDDEARKLFSKSFLHPLNKNAVKDAQNFTYSCGEKILFSTRVGDIAMRNLATAPQDISIREAARLMTQRRTGSLIFLDAAGAPIGIVTDSDLRDKVVSQGRDVNEPVSTVMTSSIHSVDAGDYCYEAVLMMIKNNVHHLIVMKEQRLWGILTNHDLMLLQGTSPLAIVKDIESQSSVNGLIPVSGKINGVYNMLLSDGARAGNVLRIITEINDRLVRKVITLTEEDLSPPPVAYAWIVFGSEGRKEQTFKTDQDNAVIYGDPADELEAQAAHDYFARFSVLVRDNLLKVGFPPCPGNYMASNPIWRQPLKTWKKYAANWTATPSSKAVLNTVTIFDSRTINGDESLLTAFREHLQSHITGNRLLLGNVASLSIKNAPPIGFLKAFVVEKSGEHKDMLNLKVKGVAPIVDLARLFALEKGVGITSTLKRIESLADTHSIVKEYAEELIHAFEFIMLLRIQHQFEKIRRGLPPDNFIRPDKLTNLQKRTVREAFQIISKIQGMVIERYREMIW